MSILTQEKMVKLTIFIYHKYFDETVLSLGKLGNLHIVDIKDEIEEGINNLEVSERYHVLRSQIGKMELLFDDLGIDISELTPILGDYDFEKNEKIIKQLQDASNNVNDIDTLTNELLTLYSYTKAQLEIEEFRNKCGTTKSTRIIVGWVPKKQLDSTTEVLNNSTNGVLTYTIDENISAPSKISFTQSNRIFKTFSNLTTGFGYPTYSEINPTALQIPTYILIFGLMFGDFAQGLILFVAGLAFELARRKKMSFGGEIGDMILKNGLFLAVLGFSATFFGLVVYGVAFGSEVWGSQIREFFGLGILNQYYHDPLKIEVIGISIPVIFEPFEAPMQLFKLSMVIGSLHIMSGLLISIVNNLRKGNTKEAIAGPGVWLWFYMTFVYIMFYQIFKHGFTAIFNINIIVLLLIPMAVMIAMRYKLHKGEGISDSLESILTTLSHTVSYARILALCLTHEAFNKIFLIMGAGIGPFMPLAILFGTIVVLMLEGALAIIQTLRLHWVEWFTKFYSGDGTAYSPFKIYKKS